MHKYIYIYIIYNKQMGQSKGPFDYRSISYKPRAMHFFIRRRPHRELKGKPRGASSTRSPRPEAPRRPAARPQPQRRISILHNINCIILCFS